MPGTAWSAPSSPLQNAASNVISSFATTTTYDISPGLCPIPPGALSLGTRVRIDAHGSYIGAGTTALFTFSLNMNQAGTAIGTTPAILTTGPQVTCVSVSGIPWGITYKGHMAAVSTTTGTTASIVGRGWFWFGTSLTAISFAPVPQTLAAVTVAQTATGLITYTEQNVIVALATGSNVTNLTSVTTDELTCELIG
jgi:hypothetical protein